MTCAEYSDRLIDAWLDAEFPDMITCVFDAQIGELTFGLLMYGGFMTALYVRTQSLVVPMVVTLLGGTLAVSRIPSAAHQLLAMLVLLVFSLAITLIYVRVQNIT